MTNGVYSGMCELQSINYAYSKNSLQIFLLNGINEEHFNTYKEHYKFITSFYEKYGKLPSKETLQSRFPDNFEWITVTDPEESIVSRLKEAKLFRDLIGDYKEIGELIKAEKSDLAIEKMASLSQQYLKQNQTKCIDLIDDVGVRFNSYVERVNNPDRYFVSTGLEELDNILGGWDREEESACICARTGIGKCHEKGTLVLMADGTKKKVEDIVVGDKVQSINGANTVFETHNGISNGYKIIPTNGDSFNVSDSHILSLYKNGVGVVDISVEDYLKLRKNQQRKYFIERTPIDYEETKVENDTLYDTGISVGNSICFEDGSLSDSFRIPHNFIVSSREQRLYLLAGLIDSKCCRLKADKARIKLNHYSFAVIDDISQLARGLGYKVCVKNKKERYGEDYKVVYLYGDFSTIPLQVKNNPHCVFSKWKDYVHTRFKIEPVDRVEYYGFACDGDHRFLLGDNTLTHNSWWTIYFALQAAKAGLRVGYYSGEMAENLVGYRLDTFMGNLSNGSLTHGNGKIKEDYETYVENLSKAVPGHIYCITPEQCDGKVTVNKLRAFVEKYDLQMLCVDQFSLLDDQRGARTPREQAVNISKDLRILQKTKKIPILQAVQLNREENENGPSTRNISESDRIGQDATTVLFIERKNDNVVFTVGKARNANTGDKLTYAWNVNMGTLHYIPTENDARKGEGAEELLECYNDSDKSDSVF